jgi:S-adenosylmethionine decarboxylase
MTFNGVNYEHFIEANDIKFAGIHIMMDLYGIKKTNEEVINVLEHCLNVIGATIIKKNIHYFPENNGITGCYTLAESHLTFHSWWESDGCLILDFFTCGDSNAFKGLNVIRDGLNPKKSEIRILPRGSVYITKKDKFFVYVLIDPRNDLPFYVGEGTQRRLYSTTKLSEEMLRKNPEKYKILEELKKLNIPVKQHIVTWDTIKPLALLIETYLVDYYKTIKNGGSLTNINSLCDVTNIKKISETLKEYWNNISIEEKKKRSESIKKSLEKITDETKKEKYKKRSENLIWRNNLKESRKKVINYWSKGNKNNAKKYIATYIDGKTEIIEDIRKYCIDTGFKIDALRIRLKKDMKIYKNKLVKFEYYIEK